MLKENLTQEQMSKVSAIVGDALRDHCGSEFVFDPIVIKPDFDGYGDAYLRVLVVFEGDQEALDPAWTGGLNGRIKGSLIELGVPPYPSISYIRRSEWRVMGPKYLREGT